MDCLESLEDCELEHQAIVVDNASTDGTVAAVRERFPSVELIADHGNRGFAYANNLALDVACGEHVLFLNPDTVVPRDALSACLHELESQPDVGMLGCKLVQPDGSLDHAAKRGFPTPLSSLYHFIGLTRVFPRSPRLAQYTAGHVDPDQTAQVDAVNGAFMLVRRQALEQVGPMDEEYWLYMEDLDWCYRFWQAGWAVLYWPGATVVHVKGGSATKHRAWRTNHAFHRGMWLFYRKHYLRAAPLPVTVAVFAGIWIKLGVSALSSWVSRSRASSASIGA